MGSAVVGGVDGVAVSPQARVVARRTGRQRLAKATGLLSFERSTGPGETTVPNREGLGGLALIEVVIAIVLVGMLCAVAVAALAA
jgi:hypothetical protein